MANAVRIVEYNSRWPDIYEKEEARILAAIGNKIVAVEHIGSTAVPGLGAKPIIDIMVGINSLSDAKECTKSLEKIGYEYVPEYETSIPERRYFRKGPSHIHNRHYHLHMVEKHNDFWNRHLLFRDYLRAHRNVAQEYSRLKKKLAFKHGTDREAYTEAKTVFIESVVRQARLTRKLRLRYVRLPNKISEMCDELVYRSKNVIVGTSQTTSAHPVVFNGKVVLSAGFRITYFELPGKWFTVGKIRDLKGKHTGYYCDIVTPVRSLDDGGVELTDLFLDLWVSPDLKYKVLDEEELDEALHKGWITEQLHGKAKKEMEKLVELVKQKKFPPDAVKLLERKLRI